MTTLDTRSAEVQAHMGLVGWVIGRMPPTVIRKAGGREECEQIGRIVIWRCFAGFKPELGQFSTYAVSALKRAFLKAANDATKHSARFRQAYVEELATCRDRQHESPDLDRAVASLRPTERDVIVAKFFEERSSASIAQDRGVSHARIYQIIQRALSRLRETVAR